MTIATVSFYSLEYCGYYERGNIDPAFADTEELFQDLYGWLTMDGLTIKESQTYVKPEGRDLLPVYRYKIKQFNGSEYLLVIWNEVETSEGKITSIAGDSSAENASISVNHVPENNIPGFPTYFWIQPSHKRIATIQFGNRIRGMNGLQAYIIGFMEKFSQWVAIQEGQTRSLDREISGYINGDQRYNGHSIFAKFKYKLMRHRGEIEYIRENREQITKIIKKDRFESSITNNNGLLRAMLTAIGLNAGNHNSNGTSNYRYEFEINPSSQELENIIDNWLEDENSWSDVGFKFKGLQAPKWLNSSEVKGEFELNVTWEHEQTVVDLNTLEREINGKRADILAILDED